MSRASMSKYFTSATLQFSSFWTAVNEIETESKDNRAGYVQCEGGFQLFLCLMRHTINTITLFGKLHVLQVYRRDCCVPLWTALNHSTRFTHAHTTLFTTDTVFILFPPSCFLACPFSTVRGRFNDRVLHDDGSRRTCKNCVRIDSVAYLKTCVH